jgi:Flp pilus assembly CpaE family ATPase
MDAAKAFDQAPSEWVVRLHRTAPEDADVLVSVGCVLEDAIPFDPARPALVVDEVASRVAGKEQSTVVVVAASGGCGASSVALHLAAEASRRTCLVGGTGHLDLAPRLGLEPEAALGAPVSVPGGFRLTEVADERLAGAVDELASGFDAVIVDGGRHALASLAPRSPDCVLVLAPTVPSASAAAELLDGFPDARWAVVTNRLGPGGETSTAELQRILSRRISLELPCSRGLRDAEGERRLVSTWSPWRRRVARLARALELR